LVNTDKRMNVKNTHDGLRKICEEFGIPIVKKTFGKNIVRVCCRSVIQLQNIVFIIKQLVNSNLIQEIGMPLEYDYQMRTLVLFIKPVNDFASTAAAMNDVFNQNFLQYRHHVIEVDYPTFEANKIFKKEKRTTNVENTDMKNRTRRSVMKKNRMNQSVLRRNKTVWKANQESMKEIHRIRSVQEEQNEPQMLNNCMKILSFLILIEILILMFRMSTN